MKLSKSLLAAIALGVSVSVITTSCQSSKKTCETKCNTETGKVSADGKTPSPTKKPFRDPCPACGMG